MTRQRRHGVSPANQNFHAQNGAMILKIMGVIGAVCFWPFLMKVAIGVVAGLFLYFVFQDLWKGI